MKAKRIRAAITAAIFLAAIIISVSFIAAEADHECSGDFCCICTCILNCGKFLSTTGALNIVSAPAILVYLLFRSTILKKNIPSLFNPVSLKVRLLN